MALVSLVRSHNPDKMIITHSSYQLSDIKKTVLTKNLNFALPLKKLNYDDYLTPYELLFRYIKELSVDDSILERVKVDMRKIYLSAFPHLKTLGLKMNWILPLINLKRWKIYHHAKKLSFRKQTKATPLVFWINVTT